jgi:transposase
MNERPVLSKLSHEEKDALIGVLLRRLEKQDERIKELERRLGLSSGNSGKPPSSDGYGKKPSPQNLREKTGKKSGGQEGHKGKNLRQVENPNTIVDHYPSQCAGCGEALGLEQATGHRKRQLFDLPKPQPVEVTEHRAHSCACPRCGTKTDAAFPHDVTAAAQYGANIAALVVYLQHWHFVPEDRLAELIKDVFGIDLTTATIAAMARRKADEWSGLANHIGEEIKQVDVKHMDETGLRVAGVLQWLHVASTWLLTFYRASSKRGAMLENVAGIVVHDFWRPYFTMNGITHALCNAHHLRELKALIDIEKEPWALAMFRFLRHACHAANLARERNEPLKPAFLDWLLARYDRIVAQGLAFHEAQAPLDVVGAKKRGRIRRRAGHNLLLRLRGHKDDALRFLTNPAVPFTNNQAERDIRMMKLKQKISGCFRTEVGANTFVTIRTVLSTARKQGWNILDTLSQPTEILAHNLRTA